MPQFPEDRKPRFFPTKKALTVSMEVSTPSRRRNCRLSLALLKRNFSTCRCLAYWIFQKKHVQQRSTLARTLCSRFSFTESALFFEYLHSLCLVGNREEILTSCTNKCETSLESASPHDGTILTETSAFSRVIRVATLQNFPATWRQLSEVFVKTLHSIWMHKGAVLSFGNPSGGCEFCSFQKDVTCSSSSTKDEKDLHALDVLQLLAVFKSV